MRIQLAALAFVLISSPYLIYSQEATHTHTPPQIIGPDTPQQTSDSGIRIRAISRLVIVDAVVTDSHGDPVHDLKREDFKLTESSDPQEIRDFEQVTPSKPLLTIAPKMPPLPPNVYTNFQQAPAGEPAINLLLLDALNTPLADQMYVRQEMLKYLKTMPPGAHIAVFTLSSQLRILQGFTTDSSALIKALYSSAASPRNSPLLENPFEQSLADQYPQGGEDLQRFESDNSTLRVDLRVKATMNALTAIAAYLSGIPGRKNLIWFSAAFPLHLLPNSDLEDGGFSVSRDYGPELRAVTDSLTLGQIAIYPVDARGLFPSPILSAENRGGQYSGRGSSSRFATDNSAFSRNLASEHQAMDQIARDTGGRAFYNTNGIREALSSAIENGSNYYRLSYTPTNKNIDGRFRKIKITVAHSGYKLSYRRGYLANDLESEKYTPRISITPMQTAMQPAAPSSSQIVFKARVLPTDELTEPLKEPDTALSKESFVKGTSRKYVIDYVAAVRDIAFSATPDGLHHGSIDVEAIAYDATGKMLAHTSGHLNANVNPSTFADISTAGMPLRQVIYLPSATCSFA